MVEERSENSQQDTAYRRLLVCQIDDARLVSLRLCGCNVFHVQPDPRHYANDDKFNVTEEGLLNYCFTLDDGLPVPESRTLQMSRVTLTPAFFNKIVQVNRCIF